ncbi:MAG TPA: hypothetical protein VH988_22970 [Thermoanaerobaculia bacterium]|nr:hypothetical protein [Thermoanaerobaculia bacterium]
MIGEKRSVNRSGATVAVREEEIPLPGLCDEIAVAHDVEDVRPLFQQRCAQAGERRLTQHLQLGEASAADLLQSFLFVREIERWQAGRLARDGEQAQRQRCRRASSCERQAWRAHDDDPRAQGQKSALLGAKEKFPGE